MYPDREYLDIQMDFADYVGEILRSDRNTSTVTVIPAKPGIGKTTTIQAYLQDCINHNTGAIFITDSTERLRTVKDLYTDDELEQLDEMQRFYYRNRNQILLLTTDNYKQDVIKREHYPIVMITTQRFARMTKADLRDFVYFKANALDRRKRQVMIFDETPTFYQRINIGVNELNAMDTALKDGITDRCPKETKDNVLTQFRRFSEYLQNVIANLEYKRNGTLYAYWFDENKHNYDEDGNHTYRVFEDDRLFKDVFDEYKSTIERSFNHKKYTAELIYRMIYKLIRDGGFFMSTKTKDQQEYSKSFFVIEDCTEKLIIDDEIKTFVFDGTATTDWRYIGRTDDLFDIVDCDEYSVPLDYMTVNIIKCNTSKRSIIKDKDRKSLLKLIKDCIKSKKLDMNDTLLVSYSDLIENGTFNDCGILASNMGYFGNLKGFNHWNDKHNYIQIGMNRFPELEYMITMFQCQPEYYDYARQAYIDNPENAIALFDAVTGHTNHNKNDSHLGFVDGETLNDVMGTQITADTIQNIYRCAARNFSNREPVNLYLFYNYASDDMSGITKNLRYELERLGAKIVCLDLPGLGIRKSKIRKSQSGLTQPQKFFLWYDHMEIGREYTSKDIYTAIGLTKKQFQELKKSSKDVKRTLVSIKMSGKNRYQKMGVNL